MDAGRPNSQGGNNNRRNGKKRSHGSGHSQAKPANHLENHPLFQRRVSRLHEKRQRKNYFAWLRVASEAIAAVSKYVLPKKKLTDPNLPVLGLREIEELRKLSFSAGERKKLLLQFREITGEKRSSASFRAFSRYFRLAPDVWAMRTFEIVNYQLSGAVTFLEYAAFLVKYLLVDRATTEEFCFRLLSRRGITFLPEHSILDLEDFLTIVMFRYKEFRTLPIQKKVALDVFSFVDADNDGGISIEEFRAFSAKNPVLLRMAHLLLNHLRKCIFGLDFWVEKTRVWRSKQSNSGVTLTTPANQRNAESELFFGQMLKEPVVDAGGAPLTNAYYLRQYEAKKRTEHEHTVGNLSAQNSIVATSSVIDSNSLINNPNQINGNGNIDGVSTKPPSFASLNENHLSPSPSVASLGLHSNSIMNLSANMSVGSFNSQPASQLASREQSFLMDGDSRQDSQSQISLGDRGLQMLLTTGANTQALLTKDQDYRTLNAFKPSFSLQKILENVTFSHDFPEIVSMRQAKRRERRQQEQLRREHIIQLKRDAYIKLIKVCSDFLFRRRDVRSAFDRWLIVTEKESRAEVNAPHRSELHRVDENLPPDWYSQEDGADSYYIDGWSLRDDSSMDDIDALANQGMTRRSPLHTNRSKNIIKTSSKRDDGLPTMDSSLRQSNKSGDNDSNTEFQVVMLGTENNLMDRDSTISALSNDFFFPQPSLDLLVEAGSVHSWPTQLPPLPTSPLAGANFNEPFDKSRNFDPDAVNSNIFSGRSTDTPPVPIPALLLARAEHPASRGPLLQQPSNQSLSSAMSSRSKPPTRQNFVQFSSPNALSPVSHYSIVPFLDSSVVEKQKIQTQLIQEEIDRSFHPHSRPRSSMHASIIRDDDRRHAEKEVNAADEFAKDYLESHFSVSSNSTSSSSFIPLSAKAPHRGASNPSPLKRALQPPASVASSVPAATPTTAASISSPISAASSLLLKKKPLPNTGSSRESKILFLQQRAIQAQKVLVDLDRDLAAQIH